MYRFRIANLRSGQAYTVYAGQARVAFNRVITSVSKIECVPGQKTMMEFEISNEGAVKRYGELVWAYEDFYGPSWRLRQRGGDVWLLAGEMIPDGYERVFKNTLGVSTTSRPVDGRPITGQS